MPGFLDAFKSDNNQNTNQNQNQNSDNNQNNQNNDSNNQNNNSQSNNGSNNDDNNNNNVDNNTSIWDNTTSNQDNNDQNNNQQNQNNQQNNNNNQNQQTAAEIFDEHVSGLNLTSGVDLSKLQEEAAEGNFDSINSAFETVAANTYKAALQQMNTLADNKIAAAIDKAVSESSSAMNENMAIKEMHVALPFAGDKDIAPVAEAAMKQIMSQGASVTEAIEKVGQFFQSTAQKINGNSNNHQNSGFNPDGNVNQQNNNNTNQDEESWMDFLTNKK